MQQQRRGGKRCGHLCSARRAPFASAHLLQAPGATLLTTPCCTSCLCVPTLCRCAQNPNCQWSSRHSDGSCLLKIGSPTPMQGPDGSNAPTSGVDMCLKPTPAGEPRGVDMCLRPTHTQVRQGWRARAQTCMKVCDAPYLPRCKLPNHNHSYCHYLLRPTAVPDSHAAQLTRLPFTYVATPFLMLTAVHLPVPLMPCRWFPVCVRLGRDGHRAAGRAQPVVHPLRLMRTVSAEQHGPLKEQRRSRLCVHGGGIHANMRVAKSVACLAHQGRTACRRRRMQHTPMS